MMQNELSLRIYHDFKNIYKDKMKMPRNFHSGAFSLVSKRLFFDNFNCVFVSVSFNSHEIDSIFKFGNIKFHLA